jgi:hypothetical protein
MDNLISYFISNIFVFPDHLMINHLFKKLAAFWDIAPCNLVGDRRFRGAYCLDHQGDE